MQEWRSSRHRTTRPGSGRMNPVLFCIEEGNTISDIHEALSDLFFFMCFCLCFLGCGI